MFKMTPTELIDAHRAAIDQLIAQNGSKSHLAKLLGVSTPTVQMWEARGRISKEGARIAAKHPTLKRDFPLSVLRPELQQ